jgi:hypothetical protein
METDQTRERWTSAGASALISIREDVTREEEMKTKNCIVCVTATMYNEIARRLQAKSIFKTGKQCREKFDNMLTRYHKMKDRSGLSGAAGGPQGNELSAELYQIMDSTFGKSSSSTPKCTLEAGVGGKAAASTSLPSASLESPVPQSGAGAAAPAVSPIPPPADGCLRPPCNEEDIPEVEPPAAAPPRKKQRIRMSPVKRDTLSKLDQVGKEMHELAEMMRQDMARSEELEKRREQNETQFIELFRVLVQNTKDPLKHACTEPAQP